MARRPKDEDRGFVRERVAAGYAEDAMRAAIRDRAASKPASWQPASMSYYDGVVKERCCVRPPPAPAASNGHAEPAPVVPEEPDEPAPEGDSPEARFQRMRRDLKREVGPVEFRTWLGAMTLVSVIDGEATMGQTTRFLSDWVRGHHGDRLLRLWQLQDPTIRRVKIVVSPAQPAAAPD